MTATQTAPLRRRLWCVALGRGRTEGRSRHQGSGREASKHGLGAFHQPPSHPKGAWGRNLPNCVPFRTAPSIGSQRGSTLPSRAKLTAPTPAEGNNAAGPSGAGQSGSVEAGPPATHAPARVIDTTKKPNSAPKHHRAPPAAAEPWRHPNKHHQCRRKHTAPCLPSANEEAGSGRISNSSPSRLRIRSPPGSM